MGTSLLICLEQNRRELGFVVHDDLVWQFGTVDDKLPYELLQVLSVDHGVRFGLDPFREIVGHYEQETLLARLGEWSDYVYCPIH